MMYSVKLIDPYIVRQHSMDNHRGTRYADSRGRFLYSIPTSLDVMIIRLTLRRMPLDEYFLQSLNHQVEKYTCNGSQNNAGPA